MSSIDLHLVGPPYDEHDTEAQMALDKVRRTFPMVLNEEFCDSLGRLAGLMFPELQTVKTVTGGTISSAIEQASPGTYSSASIATVPGDAFEIAQITSTTQATWSNLRLIRRDRRGLANRDWWLKFSSALRLLRALRLTPDTEAESDLLRICLTETGVQCLQYASEPTSSEEETAGLRMVARSLMVGGLSVLRLTLQVEEANLACLSRKSSLL